MSVPVRKGTKVPEEGGASRLSPVLERTIAPIAKGGRFPCNRGVLKHYPQRMVCDVLEQGKRRGVSGKTDKKEKMYFKCSHL